MESSGIDLRRRSRIVRIHPTCKLPHPRLAVVEPPQGGIGIANGKLVEMNLLNQMLAMTTVFCIVRVARDFVNRFRHDIVQSPANARHVDV